MAYLPFLIPLLPRHHALARAQPSGPLEEERLLRAAGEPPWATLQAACERDYGMHLLVEQADSDRRGTVEDISGMLEESGAKNRPNSALRWRCPEGDWFVLAHPEYLALFDVYGRGRDQLALASPTLYRQLAARAERPKIDGVTRAHTPSKESATMSTAEDSACLRHLGERVDQSRLSDWHLVPSAGGYLVRERIHGQLRDLPVIGHAEGEWFINVLLQRAGLANQSRSGALDGRIELSTTKFPDLGVRLSFVPGLYGTACTARFIYPDESGPPDLRTTGMSDALAAAALAAFEGEPGLWLGCGPTGSGKSTTLHALLKIAVARGEKVMSVEDPVEQRLAGVQQVSHNSPPGMCFATALKAFLRQAPDCIMIGEIRDRATAEAVVHGVRTGHRVLASFHASCNQAVYQRMEDLGQPRAVVDSLRPAFLHQRLIPVLCPNCSGKGATRESSASCRHCDNGISGRRGVFAVKAPGWKPPPPSLKEELNFTMRRQRLHAAAVDAYMKQFYGDNFLSHANPLQ